MRRQRRFRKTTRRGQIDIPFHLIFTMVGGTLFLIFFFILIRSVISGGEQQNARDLSFAVETILSTSMANPDTFTVANLQEATFVMICDDTGSYVRPIGKSVETGAQSFDTQALVNVPFFSLRSITGDELFTSTHTWEAPFAIGNLVVVANNRTQYVFVSDDLDPVERFIDEENLGAFDHRLTYPSLADIEPVGHDHYRFIYFDKTPEPDVVEAKFGDVDHSIIYVALDEGSTEKGAVTFYLANGNPDDPAVPYFGEAMLTAAIFTESKYLFTCNFLKAQARMSGTITLLTHRAQDLIDNTDTDPVTGDPLVPQDCKDKYAEDALPHLNTILDEDHGTLSTEKIEELYRDNRELLSMDCPLIY